MKYEKEILMDDFPGVYAVGHIVINNTIYYMAASENRDGKAYLIHSGRKKAFELTGGAGGVMGMLAAPESGRIVAIEGFYPVFDSAEAKLVSIDVDAGEEGGLSVCKKTMGADMPYIHRAGLLKEPDGIYLAAGKLCGKKLFPEDWSSPGTMEIGKYVSGKADSFEVVQDGIYKHHAMYVKENENGFDDLYYGGDTGVFLTVRGSGRWITRKLTDVPASDIVYEDIDGDGQNELIVIEGFHGDRAVIFKDHGNGFEREIEIPMNFGHVLWGGKLLGEPALILGSRGGERQLALYKFSADTMKRLHITEESIIDKGQAPAQITVINGAGSLDIIAANHGAGQLIRYRFTQ